jgi:hypothetical protein
MSKMRESIAGGMPMPLSLTRTTASRLALDLHANAPARVRVLRGVRDEGWKKICARRAASAST